MYKNILLPLDLTDKHGPAVETAAKFARQTGGRVVLLHVIELIQGLPREEDRPFYDRLEQSARAHLDKVGMTLTAHQVTWEPVLLFGHRLEETMRFAVDQGCDLIAVTSPRFDPAKPAAGWGSMSFKISVLSPAPVLIVKV